MTDTVSHLFYISRAPRPFLDRAEGIYLWDQSGKRYIDGTSGAMVSNMVRTLATLSSPVRCPNHSAVMIETIDALDA